MACRAHPPGTALVGVGLALAYRADLLALFGLAAPWPWLSYAVTGLVIGRGANFVHDFATRWLTPTRDGLSPAG